MQDERVAKGVSVIGLRISGLNEDLEEEAGLQSKVNDALMKYADISVFDEQTGQLRNYYLLYLSFQTVIFDSYEIWKLKSSKKKASAGIIRAQEEQLQDANEPAAPTPMPTNREATPDIKPVEIAIAPELHEKNRASYEDRQKQEEAERIRMVMEYIHFVMPRIADKETVNHICAEVNKWMCLHSYKPKPITGRLTREITNIPLRHFVWNISERFMYKKYYNGDNRANFIKTLFPREFADTDIATIKNFKVDPSKTLIPIDEPENGSLDFHYPEDYARKVNS